MQTWIQPGRSVEPILLQHIKFFSSCLAARFSMFYMFCDRVLLVSKNSKNSCFPRQYVLSHEIFQFHKTMRHSASSKQSTKRWYNRSKVFESPSISRIRRWILSISSSTFFLNKSFMYLQRASLNGSPFNVMILFFKYLWSIM